MKLEPEKTLISVAEFVPACGADATIYSHTPISWLQYSQIPCDLLSPTTHLDSFIAKGSLSPRVECSRPRSSFENWVLYLMSGGQ